MTKAIRIRPEWTDIPVSLRAEVEAALGALVVNATNSQYGFSSGVAATCILADGRIVFIKAASGAGNPFGAELHIREIAITASLPAVRSRPRLLHSFVREPWVILVLEHVAGVHPDPSWPAEQRRALFASLQTLHEEFTPAPLGPPKIQERWGAMFTGWRSMAAGDTPDGATKWVQTHAKRLAAMESRWEGAASGNTLLHSDLRADNMLFDTTGEVQFIDWPWACVGARFFDLLFMLPSMVLSSGLPPSTVWAEYSSDLDFDDEAVSSVLAAVAGFFTYQGLQPGIPAVPGLREFQSAQGAIALDWLRARDAV